MSWPVSLPLTRKWSLLVTTGLLLLLGWQVLLLPAHGAQLGNRVLRQSTSIAGQAGTYQLAFTTTTAGTVGSISFQFCANSPFTTDVCTAPSGFAANNATLVTQTGQTGFTVNNALTNANTIVLSRAPGAAPVGATSYTFDNVINPGSPGSYYVRLQTFASRDASGPYSDYGGIAFAVNANLSITAEVPPYLIFCAAVSIPTLNCNSADGDHIDFGEFSPTHPSQGSSQFMAATNAKNGYNITLAGTTLTSGNNIINALALADVSRPGVAQFGMNLRANASPSGGIEPAGPGSASPEASYGQPNFYRFVPGDIVVSNARPDDVRRYTASYLVNVPKTQSPGIYASTVTYICLGSF